VRDTLKCIAHYAKTDKGAFKNRYRSYWLHNSKYGYDIEIEAGYLQYADNMQMDEIRDTFMNNHGISV